MFSDYNSKIFFTYVSHMKIRKEEINLLLFIGDIVYIENPKESIEKLWKSIRQFGYVAEYKIEA